MEKTAMQQLRDILETTIGQYQVRVESHYERGYMECLKNVISDIDAQMMEIEKEQIKTAFGDGLITIDVSCEQYYSKTFSK